MDYKSSSELKALARGELSGKYGVPVGVVFLATLISAVVTLLVTVFLKTDSVTSTIIYYLVSYIISILAEVLNLGLVKFFLSLCRKREYQVSDLLWGFQNHPDKVIIFVILLTLMFLGCLLPGCIFLGIVLGMTSQPLLFLCAMIVLIAGIIGVFIIVLNYSIVRYLIVDESEYTITETMRASRELMKGHKGRMFYLQISFIGWYLLAFLSCGIALLWIEPYRMATNSYFYMDLRGELRTNIIDERV